MPTLGYIGCSIVESDGSTLQEYPVPDQSDVAEASATTVYIPAEENKPFQVKISVKNSFPWPTDDKFEFNFRLSIDGTTIGHGNSKSIGRHSAESYSYFRGPIFRKPDSTWERKSYVFSGLRVMDDGPANDLSRDDVAKLGEIKIVVRRFLLQGLLDMHPIRAQNNGKGELVLHEKALKGRDLTHTVRSSREGVRTSAPKVERGEFLDTVEKPFAVFRFLYRSKRTLKTLGLIQRTPSPEVSKCEGQATARESDPQNMTKQQMVEEITRLRAQASRSFRPSVKRERESSDLETKSEPGVEREIKRVKEFTKLEVIDLTGDD